MWSDELIPHLFRTEHGKITTVLCKLFGLDHIEVAEDLASETFVAALETWTYKGVPENPTAWLYAVAKNKARNYINRDKLYAQKILPQVKKSSEEIQELEIDCDNKSISDAQLQMLFAICHPSIPQEAQIGLALRILCGFSIDEIANAFLTNKETINKRLFRAKEKLREEKVELVLPGI
ncbi:MAG TPA: sigma-70 family RNA polymerase sigma factor, partial [Chitinophagaceae bacterium]